MPRLLLFLILMNGFMLASLPGIKPLLFFPISTFHSLYSTQLTDEVLIDFHVYELCMFATLFLMATVLTRFFRPSRNLMIIPPFLGFLVYLFTGITFAYRTGDTLIKTVLFLTLPLFLFQAVPWWLGFVFSRAKKTQ